MYFRYFYVKIFTYLQLNRMSLIHEYSTSHTKVYLVVSFGSGNTVRIHLIIFKVMLSCIHCNVFRSHRVDLLSIVSHTLVRWLGIVNKNVTNFYLICHILVIAITLINLHWLIPIILMPFSCTFCGFAKFPMYFRNNIIWQHLESDIIMFQSALSISHSKNATPPLYFYRHG